MALQKPFSEGEAGPYEGPADRFARYLQLIDMYRAMGIDPLNASGGIAPTIVPTASQLVAESAGAPAATEAAIFGSSAAAASNAAAGAAGGAAGNLAGNAAAGAANGVPDWLAAAFKAMAGVGTGLAALNAPRGLSDEEKAFQAQAARLLKQQEQRTQFQNPLYAYITRQAYNLQPGPDKGTYPYSSLDDVQVP